MSQFLRLDYVERWSTSEILWRFTPSYTDQAEFAHVRSKLQSLLDEDTFTAASLEGWYLGLELAIDLAEKIFGNEV